MSKTHARPLVLVVDPDQAQHQAVKQLLTQHYRVIGAQSLAEADSLLSFYLPAIVLVELNEPDGDGINWIRHLRQDVTLHNLGVGCVTARSGVRDKVNGFQAGADIYIVKPLLPETFLARIIVLQRIREVGNDQW